MKNKNRKPKVRVQADFNTGERTHKVHNEESEQQQIKEQLEWYYEERYRR